MSNTAKVGIPTVGDNGKGIIYNESLDRWDVTDVATQAELNTHTGLATGAHAATAISFTAGGTIAATTVQAAIDEVSTETATNLANHEADTTAIHGIANTANLYAAGGTDVAVADGGTGSSTAPLARVALGIDKRTTFTNAAYTILTTDKYVAQVGTLTLSRVVTLPAANAVNAGYEIIVADESGSVTATNTLVITRAGTDTVDAGTTSTISTAYGVKSLVSDGVSKWIVYNVKAIGIADLAATGTPSATTFLRGDNTWTAQTTVANDAVYDVKGDIAVATAADTATRLAIGANNFVLTADSAEATGVKWAASQGNLLAANNLSDVANAATARTNLGLAIGTNVQAYDAELAALAGLVSAADKLPYFTGIGTAAVADLSVAGRALIDDIDAATQRTTLGVDYTTTDERARDVLGTALVAGTSIAITVNDAADTITVATSGLVIGTNVQAYDAELAALAGLTSAADSLPYFTGLGTAALTTLTATGRALIDDASISAQRVTLGVDKRTTFTDAAYTVLSTDKHIAQVGTLTASRIVTLPAANAVNAGYVITITDESGSVTGTNTLVITRAGTDTVNGGTTLSICTAYGTYGLVSDGTSKWVGVAKGTRMFYGTTAPTSPSVGDVWLDTTP